jgi:hypothetical protein
VGEEALSWCGSESSEGNRAYKERLVREGKAHAALVFDGDVAVGPVPIRFSG